MIWHSLAWYGLVFFSSRTDSRHLFILYIRFAHSMVLINLSIIASVNKYHPGDLFRLFAFLTLSMPTLMAPTNWMDPGSCTVDSRLSVSETKKSSLSKINLSACDYIEISPEEGMMILLPSWLQHSVVPLSVKTRFKARNEGARISLAFNFNQSWERSTFPNLW